MSARDVAFTLMALGQVAGCRGKSATEILAEAVGEIVRLQTEVVRLTAENEEYAQRICDECGPDNYGWVFNRVEGRGACTCMIEAEPFQILSTALETVRKAATGEIQIADDDTEGMRWVANTASTALHSVLPLDYPKEAK